MQVSTVERIRGMLSITTEILTLDDIYGIFTIYSICNDFPGDIKLSNIQYFNDFNVLFILRFISINQFSESV